MVYKKPNLNAPRFRPKKLNLTNRMFYDQFVEEHPKMAALGVDKFKEVISVYNGRIWEKVIEERDGVELPEQLGFLFIGTCPRKKDNVDHKKSGLYGIKIQNQNWESDHYIAKIFYTNFENKYRFKHHELWGFTGVRDFKRMVGKTYPAEWKKYVMVDNLVRVSRLFRVQKFKQQKQEEAVVLMEQYDEFNLEDPWQDPP